MDELVLSCPSLCNINMYPLSFVNKGTIHVRERQSRRTATPILRFHPSKRHATLITSCDQGSIVLAFTLVLLVLKRF